MKEARRILNNAGLSLYMLAIFFSLIKDYIIIPAISKLWEMSLMTTPYGFISNANIGETILKSPWIILIGLSLIGVFLTFSMWQVVAVIVGAAYACEGKKIKFFDVLRISVKDILQSTRLRNWIIVVYTIIILPFTDVFQATEYVGAFSMPEYIQDFIDANAVLRVLAFILFFVALYFAVRWLFLLPSFYLKGFDLKNASRESYVFTRKCTLKEGIKLFLYSLIETVRLAIIPLVIILGTSLITLAFVHEQPYAGELFSAIAIDSVLEACGSICGVMIYLSVMCYIVKGYYSHCEKVEGCKEICLPEISESKKKQVSGRLLLVFVSIFSAVCIISIYLYSIFMVKSDPSIINSFINKPDIVAHKGYSSVAPENTMAAFKRADENENTDFIELDVWSSKDGIPVVIHDETIKSATGMDGLISDYTYEELQAIPATYSMEKTAFPDARIPSLEEVLAAYADTTPILIEIKGFKKDEELPSKVVKLMEKYNCVKTSMVQSGDYATLRAVKLCNSDVKCGLILAIVTGDCYNLPYVDFLSVEHNFVTKQMIEQLHKRGKEIYVWTVNYEESIAQLKSLKIDGYITDYPDRIAAALKENSSPLEEIINSINRDGTDASAGKEQYNNEEY